MSNGFVRDAWYVIAWSEALPVGGTVARTVLGEPLVAFRGEDGVANVVADRCPHRGVPLSMGKVAGPAIQCAYHGLRFDGAGACVHNPHVKADPGRLAVRSYPVVERFGAVWVWTGDAGRADPAKVPDYGWFDDGRAGYRTVRGQLHVQAGYRLIIDNLLDLSHAEYLHAGTVGTPGSAGSLKASVDVADERVTVLRKVYDLPPSAVFKPVWHKTERIDQHANMTWRAPSHLLLDLGIMPPGGVLDEGLHFPSAHLLTPETERSTHYFFANARNFRTDDEGYDDAVLAVFRRAFGEEDRPIVEAIQRAAVDAGDGFRFADFTIGDGAAARARRMLDRLTG